MNRWHIGIPCHTINTYFISTSPFGILGFQFGRLWVPFRFSAFVHFLLSVENGFSGVNARYKLQFDVVQVHYFTHHVLSLDILWVIVITFNTISISEILIEQMDPIFQYIIRSATSISFGVSTQAHFSIHLSLIYNSFQRILVLNNFVILQSQRALFNWRLEKILSITST